MIDVFVIGLVFGLGGAATEYVISRLTGDPVDLSDVPDHLRRRVRSSGHSSTSRTRSPAPVTRSEWPCWVCGSRAATAIGGRGAVTRTLALPLSFLLLGLGFVLILARRDRRALHDLVGRTAVVYAWTRERPICGSSPSARPRGPDRIGHGREGRWGRRPGASVAEHAELLEDVASSSQYWRSAQIRSPRNSATVTPCSVTRMPGRLDRRRAPSSSGPEWVMVTLHSAQAWSPPTSSGTTSSAGRRTRRRGVELVEQLGQRRHRQRRRPRVHVVGVDARSSASRSPTTAARSARARTAARAAFDVIAAEQLALADANSASVSAPIGAAPRGP